MEENVHLVMGNFYIYFLVRLLFFRFLFTIDKSKRASVVLFYRPASTKRHKMALHVLSKSRSATIVEGDFIQYFDEFLLFCDTLRRNIKY